MSLTTRTSTRHLSDVARHVVKPSGIVRTGWPAVEAKLEQMGLGFDLWQADLARLILGKRSDGLYAATVGGVFLSIPRQVGKTYVLSALVFALCLLNPGMLVLWTAHRLKTTGETHKAWKALARRKLIAPFIENIRSGSGDWEVIFRNGSRILLGARERGFGRGFARVDVIVFDECQILTDKALDDMIPAANASTLPTGALVLYAGTPPTPENVRTGDAEVFSRNRRDALAGTSDDVLYVECSADPSVDPSKWPPGHVDFAAIAEANASYPDRTPKASILRMAKQLSRASLRREGLGIWDDDAAQKALINSKWWTDELRQEPPADGSRFFGVKFSRDGLRVGLAGCMVTGDRVFVEAIGVYESPSGIAPLAEWLKPRLVDGAAVWVDGQAGQGVLANELRRLRVPSRRVVLPTVDQVVTAHTTALAHIENGTLGHSGQTALAEAVASGGRRAVGTRGGWAWDAIGDGDVLPLEAVTMAVGAGIRTRPTNSTGRAAVQRPYATR